MLQIVKDKQAVLAAILLFIVANPYFIWNYNGMGYSMVFNVAVETFVALLFYLNQDKKTPYGKDFKVLFCFLYGLYVLLKFAHGWRLGLVAQLPYALFIFLPLANRSFVKSTFNYFITIYSVVISLSLIALALVTIGRLSPTGIIDNVNEDMYEVGKNYIQYPFLLVMTETTNMSITQAVRFCGVFDEPGVVGTLGALLLCGMQFKWKDWRTYPIIISGVLSFSMFFFVTIIGYWAIRITLVNRSPQYVIGALVVLLGFYVATKDNPIVSELVWERLEWDSKEGHFAGDSRVSNSDAYDRMSIEEWLFGVNDLGKFWDYAKGESSYKTSIATNGGVFYVFYIFYFLYIGYRYCKLRSDFLLFVFVLLCCMYQRPGIWNILWMFLYCNMARHPLSYSDKP